MEAFDQLHIWLKTGNDLPPRAQFKPMAIGFEWLTDEMKASPV
jgi:hypothetical protein